MAPETGDRARIKARKGHYMPPSLLDSQLATLERPTAEEGALTVSVEPAPAAIVDDVMRRLALPVGKAG